jgi:6-phosphogluconolactonase (cycloisomerase 2 family)
MGANGEPLFTQTNNLIYPYPVVDRSLALGSSVNGGQSTTATSSALIFLNAVASAKDTINAACPGCSWINSGYLGIGTTKPMDLLSLSGQTGSQGGPGLSINYTGTGASQFMAWAGAYSTFIGSITNSNLFIRTNNTDRLTISSAGNVGIGTTNPQSKLDVNGSILSDNIVLAGNNQLSGAYGFSNYLSSSGGFGTGGVQRITADGNITNVGSIQAGQLNITSGGTFGIGVTYPTTGTNPRSVISADFNGDGKADLATANVNSDNMTVFINTGSGVMGTGTTYPTISADPWSVISADFNGDGKADLATANADGNNITVFINNGSGVMGTGNTYPTIGTAPRSVISADFNGDGKADLATANFNSNNITVFLNSGNGTMGTGITYPTGAIWPQSIAAADFNGDGKADLATANINTSNITVFMNNGNGTMGAGTTYSTIGTGPRSVNAADFNGDGKADLVTANATGNNITVFINNGTGIMGTGTTYPTIGINPQSIALADFNGDGKVDLAVGSYNGGDMTVFPNNGNGTFGTGAEYFFSGDGTYSVTSADFNGDGKADLAAAGYYYHNIFVFINNTTPSLFTSTTGNVGIGTTAPTQKMELAGNIFLHSDTTSENFENVTFPPTGWTTGGNANWVRDTTTKHAGTGGGASGTIIANQSSWIEREMTTEDGNLTFYWKVSSEATYDYLVFCLDNDACTIDVGYNTRISGEVDWTQVTVPVTAGIHSFRWLYGKDSAVDTGSDKGWIDDIVFPPGGSGKIFATGSINIGQYAGSDVAPGNGLLVSGNVAIGTTSSSNKLTVNGSFNLNDIVKTYGQAQSSLSLSADHTKITTTGFAGSSNNSYATGESPYSGAIGDLNNDGYADMAVANMADHTMSVYLNNKDGTFTPQTVYATGQDPYAVAIGDVNNDGYADLAVANNNSSFVSVYINNKDGTFAAEADYASNSSGTSVAIGDLNNDGWADMVINNGYGDAATVFINDGDGTFAAGVNYTTGTAPSYVAMGDLNNDGYKDIVTSNWGTNIISVLINDKDGTFAAKADYTIGGIRSEALAIADFNHDGYADIAATSTNAAVVSILINDKDGTFAPKVDYRTGSVPTSVLVGDLNRDGWEDLTVLNSGENTYSIFINNKNGTFATKADIIAGTSPLTAAIGDVNNDGYPDLASVNQTENTVMVYINNKNGTYQANPEVTTYNWPGSVTAADFNKDGYDDLAVANLSTDSISVFMNNKDGTFAETADYTTANVPYAIASGDLNNDGYPDLAAPLNNDNVVAVFLNDKDGTFASAANYATTSNPRNVAIGDLNNDGWADLAVTDWGTTYVSVFINDKDGTFAAKADYATGSFPTSVSIGDLNNDGYADMAVANSSSDTVSVFINDKDGTFAAKADYPTGDVPNMVAISDFNRDGYRDLAVTNMNNSSISILLNDKDGTFGQKTDYGTGFGPYSIIATDINKDGFDDLAVTNYEGNSVSVLANNKDGTFAAHIDTGVGRYPQGLTAGDFNNDGYPDIAASNYWSNSISILINGAYANEMRGDLVLSGKLVGPSALNFVTNNTNRLTIDSSGNVGIGAPLPNAKLDITGTNTEGVLGAEMITATADRDFSSDTGHWSGTSGWTISGGVANHTKASSDFTLTTGMTAPEAGNLYLVSVYIDSSSAGSVGFSLGGAWSNQSFGESVTSSNVSTIIKAGSTAPLIISTDGNWAGYMDNVSVKQITPSMATEILRNSDNTVGMELRSGGSGLNNILLGSSAGYVNVTGDDNFAAGYTALISNISGSRNISIGKETLFSNVNGYSNIALGNRSMYSNISGNSNFAAGEDALFYNEDGGNNTAIGKSALTENITGDNNIAIGQYSLQYNANGQDNIAFGQYALNSNESGSRNVAIGSEALDYNVTGNENVAIGFDSGYNALGSNNVFLGNKAGYSETGSNKLYIENSNANPNNALIYGDFNTNTLTFNGNVGIGTTNPSSFTLETAGSIGPTVDDAYDLGSNTRRWRDLYLGPGTLHIGSSTSDQFNISYDTTNNRLGFFVNAATTNPKVTFDSSGNVGIGTTNPISNLDVNGSILSDNIVLAGNNMLSGYYGYNDYLNSSGGLGTGGIQRITAEGNITNISMIQAGQLNVSSGGTFGVGTTYPSIGTTPDAVFSADFNGDGLADIASANFNGNNITVYLGTGSGAMGAGTTYPSIGQYPYSVTAADLNGDGKPDLVATNGVGDIITVYMGTGSGTFGTGTTYSTIGGSPISVTSGDFNGDGKPDLVTANRSNANITVFLNTGSGIFGAGVTYPTIGTWPYSVVTSDFNGDSIADIATANNNTHNITVFLGTGSGTFGVGTTYPTILNNPRSITSGDYNGDGKSDLATADYGGDKITVFLNSGTGIFGTGATYPTIDTSPFSITSADFNGDGKTDLATCTTGASKITVFLNTGAGIFGTGATYPTIGSGPMAITSADFNNDGKPDISTANNAGNNITVLLNTATTSLFTSSAGNVGIGTTLPAAKLDISHNLQNSTALNISYADSTNTVTGTKYNYGLYSFNNNTGTIDSSTRYTYGGEFDITDSGALSGTTPTKYLNAFRASAVDSGTHSSGTSNVYAGQFTATGKSANVTGTATGVYANSSGADWNFDFYAAGASSFNYFAGNIGIGTTNPLGKLHVAGTTNPFVVMANGNVGIGITLPSANLHVYNSTLNTTAFKLDYTDSTNITTGGPIDYGFAPTITNSGNITPGGGFSISRASYGINLSVSDSGAVNTSAGLSQGQKTLRGINVAVTDSGTHVAGGFPPTINLTAGLFSATGVSANSNSTAYGVYSTSTGADYNYDFYAANANSFNYFAGNVGVGYTAPANKIQLDADTYATNTGWTDGSDRNTKENFIALSDVQKTPVTHGSWTRDGVTIDAVDYGTGPDVALTDSEILNRINLMPIKRWNFIKEDEVNQMVPGGKVNHIGPTAQDFYALFGLGASDKTIKATDMAGVALAGLKAQQAQINEISGGFNPDTGLLNIQTDNTVKNTATGRTVTSTSAFAESVIGKIRSGLISTRDFTAENITVAGQSLRDYILSVVQTSQLALNGQNAVSPVVDSLTVDSVQPATGSAGINFNLSTGQVILVNNAENLPTVRIDDAGNATFAGVLTVGTLKADRIEGLDVTVGRIDQLTSLFNTLATRSGEVSQVSQNTLAGMTGVTATGSGVMENLMAFIQGIIVKGEAVFEGVTTFLGKVAFWNNVAFKSDVTFDKSVTLPDNSAGTVLLHKYTSSVRVEFDTPFAFVPNVSLTPIINTATDSAFLADAGRAGVTDVTVSGFTVILDQPAVRDVEYSWMAISVANNKRTENARLDNGDMLGTASATLTATPSATPMPVIPTVTPSPLPTAVPTQLPTPTPDVAPVSFGMISPLPDTTATGSAQTQ